MTITGMPWSDTINSLRGVRTHVDPNFAFQRQLKHFSDHLMVQVNIIKLIRLNHIAISPRNVNDFSRNSVHIPPSIMIEHF